MSASKPVSTSKTLAAYMRGKAREACTICKLPVEIRQQLGPAAARAGFSRADQVEWLRSVGEPSATVDSLNKHLNQRHDQEDGV